MDFLIIITICGIFYIVLAIIFFYTVCIPLEEKFTAIENKVWESKPRIYRILIRIALMLLWPLLTFILFCNVIRSLLKDFYKEITK